MIPVKLQMHNFMSYGENVPPLDFQGIDLACLTGDNGVGKSTILDAMTWAIWGKARARDNDNLVKLGSHSMWIDFIFELEGKKYRVVRRHDLGRGIKSSLEFQMQQEDENSWITLTEPTKAETQEKITNTLRMNYDTFINSAFLKQGRADEFTIKRPAQRKEILGDILGLSYFDKLEANARKYVKDKEIEKGSLELQISDMAEEIKNKDEYKNEVKRIEKNLQEISSRENQMRERTKTLQNQKNDLQTKLEQKEYLEIKIRDGEEEIERFSKQIQKHNKILDICQRILAKKREIEGNFTLLDNYRRKEQEYNQKMSQKMDLEDRKRGLEKNIKDQEFEVETKYNINIAKIKDIEKRVRDSVNLEKELKILKDKVEKLKTLEKEKENLSVDKQKLSEELTSLKIKSKQIKKGVDDIEKKLGLLTKAKARCPLCGQNLTDDHRVELIKQFDYKKNQDLEKTQNNTKRIRLGETETQDITNKINKIGKELQELPQKERKMIELEKELREIENLKEELIRLKKENNDLLTFIKEEKFIPQDKKEKLEQVKRDIQTLSYDEKEHANIREKVNELKDCEEWKNKLHTAQEKIKSEESAKKGIDESIQNKRLNIKNDLNLIEKLTKVSQNLPRIEKELNEKELDLSDIQQKIESKQKEYGEILGKFDRIKKTEKDLSEKQKRLKQIQKDKSIYNELAQAFGKNGVQALIIENAIPEIEDETNLILAQMTDGKMRITFETQKEKKTDGKLVETLDIKISDQEGTRMYELYSGGEAFRINFAIRVALSRLLSHRAGAKLQLLVIDEGFGTQDMIGREHLIETISSIKADFKRILVITHIPELKDVFPTRIEISKDDQGSHWKIVQ